MSRPQLTVHFADDNHAYQFTGRRWYIQIKDRIFPLHDKALITALNAVLVEFRGRDSVSARDWWALNKVMRGRKAR